MYVKSRSQLKELIHKSPGCFNAELKTEESWPRVREEEKGRLTNVAALAGNAYTVHQKMSIEMRRLLTLAIAGPNPFHNARTPSCAIVLRAQSNNPE